MAQRFIPAFAPGADGKALTRGRRLIALDAVEWVSRSIADAPDDQLVETRSISGDLHHVRAGDLRAAFPFLRRCRAAASEGSR